MSGDSKISDGMRGRPLAPLVVLLGLLAAVGPVAHPLDAEVPEEMPRGVLDLGGEWRVAVGELPGGATPELDDSGWRRVRLPASWRQLDLRGGDAPVWLRRRVLLPPGWAKELAPNGLAILVGSTADSGYRLYAGGRRIGVHDGIARAHSVRVFPVPPEAIGTGGQLELAVELRRTRWLRDRLTGAGGPVGEGIAVGDREVLEGLAVTAGLRDRRRAFPGAILATLLAAAAFYHLQLFFLGRRSPEYLWFGVVALDFAAWTLVRYFGAELGAGEGLRRRLLAVLGHLGVALMIQFLWPLLGRVIRRSVRVYQLSQVVIAAVLLVVPLGWIAASQPGRWLYTLPALLGMALLVGREGWRERAEARVIALGGLAILLALATELFYPAAPEATAARAGSVPVTGAAFVLLAASMAVSVSRRFGRLHRELDGFRVELEAMVEEQTEELARTHRKLRSEVSERQLVEEALRMLERAVEQSADGIAVTDLSGRSHFLNEAWARMHGYEVFEVLGYEIALFHTPEQMQEQVFPAFARVREDGSWEGEIEHRRKDESRFPTWTSATLLLDAEQQPMGMVIIARDATERRRVSEERLRLEAKVQEAEKLESLAVLAAGIAHDYNNLLTGVLGNTSLVIQELPRSSTARDKVRQIELAAERAATLSDQLLAYAGEEQLALRTLEVNDLMSGLRNLLRKIVPEHVELELQLNRDLPPVDVDPAQMRQVILNLVQNGCEAIGERAGVVTVRTATVDADRRYLEDAVLDEALPPGRYTLFEVSDSGSGVDREMRQRIFDPFYSTKGSGRGLGLATALGIVRAHRGTIKVYSEVARGSTFEVLLPASAREPEVGLVEGEALQGWAGHGKILVVDDELLVREVAKDILSGCGFEVLTAAEGGEAVACYRRDGAAIRLVLLDLTMPGMDGREAFHEIRRLDPEAVVLLMSGFGKKHAGAVLEEAGEDLAGFLHKPFRPDELVRSVREILEGDA